MNKLKMFSHSTSTIVFKSHYKYNLPLSIIVGRESLLFFFGLFQSISYKPGTKIVTDNMKMAQKNPMHSL